MKFAQQRGLMLNWPALVAWAAGMALALGLHLTDTLHLFFLFVPVYVLTVVAYIVLAALGGARGPLPQAAGAAPDAAGCDRDAVPAMAEGSSRPHRDAIFWISGLIALISLIACIVLGLRVYLAAEADYAECLAWFKRWLIVPTLVYFVSATLWQVRRMRTNAR